MYHITKRHLWGITLGRDMSQCEHTTYNADQQVSRPWLLDELDALIVLQETASAINLLSDLEKVAF